MGLASPLAIYAVDFWEHSLGLALMLWGVVWLLRVLDGDRAFASAFVAGILFGGAATMRTEALVYLVVCGGITCLVSLWRSRAFGGAFLRGAVVLAGAAVSLVANDLLERLALGGTIRAARAAGTAADVGVSAGVRVQEALTTLIGMNRFEHTADYVLGGLIVACVAVAVWSFRRADDHIPLAASCAVAGALFFYLVGFSGGLGFVPGMLSASPFAAVGFVFGWRKDVRIVTAMAVLALPLVWSFQYSGGAGPQWGGRYTLLSGGIAPGRGDCGARRSSRRAGRDRTAGGTGDRLRSHLALGAFELGGAPIERIVDRHDQAVISGEAHVLREGGAFYEPSRHWLTATSTRELHQAVQIVDDGETPSSRTS